MNDEPTDRRRHARLLVRRLRGGWGWLTHRTRLRTTLLSLGLLAIAGASLAGGVLAVGLAALLLPGLFEAVGWFFLERVPALFVALPLGLASGAVLAATVLVCGAGFLALQVLKRRLRLRLRARLEAAWRAGRQQPTEA